MNLARTLLLVLVFLATVTKAEGGGCNNIQTYGLPVINMCDRGNWTLGRVFISITTSNMGSNTRCNCTLRARTPGRETNTTFQLRNVETNVSRCHESLIQLTSPDRIDITCTTRNETLFLTEHTTNDLTILLSRADALVGVSYCLYVQPVMSEDNGLELICQSDSSQQSSSTTTTTTTPTPSSSTSSMELSTISSLSSSSSTVPVTSSPLTLSQTPPSVEPTSSSSLMPPTSLSPATQTQSSPLSTEGGSTPETAPFSVGAVAGGVGGGVALIIVIVVIVTVIVCKRRQGRRKPARQPEPRGQENAAYVDDDLEDPGYSTADNAVAMASNRPHSKTSSASVKPSTSQAGSLVGLLAAPSSPYELEDELPQDDGAVSINMAAGSATLTLGNIESQPASPAGDVYAVVDKSKGKKPRKPRPAKPPKPAPLPDSATAADVTTASAGGGAAADLYAVVDKSRNKGGNARDKSNLPSSDAAPSSDLPSPGLLYADLEEVRGEGRRSAPPRPPADMATETEYADIDHVATANFASDA